MYEIALPSDLRIKDRLSIGQPEELELPLSSIFKVLSLVVHARIESLADDLFAYALIKSRTGSELASPFVVHLLPQDAGDARGQSDLDERARKRGNRVLVVDRELSLELSVECSKRPSARTPKSYRHYRLELRFGTCYIESLTTRIGQIDPLPPVLKHLVVVYCRGQDIVHQLFQERSVVRDGISGEKVALRRMSEYAGEVPSIKCLEERFGDGFALVLSHKSRGFQRDTPRRRRPRDAPCQTCDLALERDI